MRRIAVAVLVAGLLAGAGCGGPKRLPPAGGVEEPARPAVPGAPLLLGVGLAEEQDGLALSAAGQAALLDARSREVLARLAAGQEVACARRGDGVAWRTASGSGRTAAVVLRPADPADRVVHDGVPYRGEFLVLPAPAGGGVTLVNNVELEDYLRGVVPWEIGRHDRDRLAALEAQAVAARTYTISHLGARRERGFDVFASVMDQVYRGAGDEDALCNEAVERTAGLVLRYRGREISAYYSACCGGVTSNVQEVWPREGRPYLTSRPDRGRGGDPYCAGARWYSWEERWTRAHLEQLLATTLPAYLDYMGEGSRAAWAGPLFTPDGGHGDPRRPGALLDVDVRERTTSGRIARLDVTTSAGTYHVRGDRVRWVLPPPSGSPAILRSALCDLACERVEGELVGVRAEGRGYGHGIGMCQTGALEMARRGHDVQDILAHYYPGTLLARVDGRPR